MLRIGMGFDVHRFSPDRPLIIGGVRVPHTHGLLGHSDADVLTHALMDAILGALALGDIGQWFPDTDPAFAGADSIDLLRTIVSHDAVRPWTLVNADCVVMAQRPRLMAHVPAMRSRLAEALRSSADRVAIKATTTERLGFVGREEGMAAQAVVLLAADAAGG